MRGGGGELGEPLGGGHLGEGGREGGRGTACLTARASLCTH